MADVETMRGALDDYQARVAESLVRALIGMARRSISQIIARRAAEEPARVIVRMAEGRAALTAAELEETSRQMARRLLARGVRRDDLVEIALPNGIGFVLACAAVWRAGATPQPVSPELSGGERAVLRELASPAFVCDQEGLRELLEPESSVAVGWARRPAAPAEEALLAGQGASSSAARPCGTAAHGEGAPWLTRGSTGDDAALPDLWATSWKAPASSGSTGRPKIVRANAPALLDPDRPVADFLPQRAVQLVAGPLWHSAVFTYAFRGLMTGHELVLLPRFEERAWLRAAEEHRVTWGLMAPVMLHRLMRLPEQERRPERVAGLESLLHLGAPCAPELKRQVIEWLGPERVVEVYAGSESNGLTMISGEEWLQRPGSVGMPIGGTEISIRDESGRVLPPGEEGLIWMRRGEQPAYHYLGGTSRRDPSGWDTLGDLGRLDADGSLHLTDRADDVINRGGEKIYPAQIERVIQRRPAVVTALAFGEPDPEYGQVPCAVVELDRAVPTGGEPGALAELREQARQELGSRAPVRLRAVPGPLRDDAGKARRRAWAERGNPS